MIRVSSASIHGVVFAQFKLAYDKGGAFVDNYYRALAIDSAVNSGCVVINCSWKASAPTAELEESIIRATDSTTASRPYTCVFFFGAGNSGGPVAFPASMSQTIAVGAVKFIGTRCGYSSYGSELDLVGVADCTPSSCDANFYAMDQMGTDGMNTHGGGCGGGDIADVDYTRRMNGTSSTCPQAAGVAALLLSKKPSLIRAPFLQGDTTTTDMVRLILRATAKDLGSSGWDQYTGAGRISSFYALLAVMHGDINNDTFYDAVDINLLIQQLFFTGHYFHDSLGDVNCDGTYDSTDLDYLIAYTFNNGPEPPICLKYPAP
ncbi:MAG: S8 family serine peptidase [candidate division Zixibacteria bacterium]|nr:S8 family serine peptidase [candidate division Zixibacteria bacterium]